MCHHSRNYSCFKGLYWTKHLQNTALVCVTADWHPEGIEIILPWEASKCAGWCHHEAVLPHHSRDMTARGDSWWLEEGAMPPCSPERTRREKWGTTVQLNLIVYGANAPRSRVVVQEGQECLGTLGIGLPTANHVTGLSNFSDEMSGFVEDRKAVEVFWGGLFWGFLGWWDVVCFFVLGFWGGVVFFVFFWHFLFCLGVVSLVLFTASLSMTSA